MITKRVIPCLDVDRGRVVKGIEFQNLRDAGDPVERALGYEADGADELVLLDVSATREGRGHALETVRRVRRALGIPLTVGGGVRTIEDAVALLQAGADKVALNSAAWREPALVGRLAERFGSQCVTVAIDAKAVAGGYELRIAAGVEATGQDAIAWGAEVAALGAGELLVTSIDRDGRQSGYELPLIRALASLTSLPIVASGGARTAEHLAEALDCGASAVLLASILHSGDTTVAALKSQLLALDYPIRPC